MEEAMNKMNPLTWNRLALAGVVTLLLTGLLAAERPKQPKPSTYAPAKDLLAQLDYFIERIEADLQGEEYGEDQTGRVEKNATTIVAIALVLGMHDEDNKIKKSASALIKTSGDLVGKAENREKATVAFAAVKKALDEPGDGPAIRWDAVTDLALLMQQVPIVNNNLRRCVGSRRFKRSADRSAGYAATLAAIAQASLVDTSYCGDEDEEAKWIRFCEEMRSAAAEVNAAVHRLDQPAAKAGLVKVVKSCDDCHAVFVDE